MKLMDWDEEEEKAGRTEKGSRLKSDPDFGEETSDRDSGEHKPDFHERLRRGSTDREEELAPLAMWAKVLIFIGLAVLAALICAVLWNFVHPDKPEENQNSLPGNIEASGDNSAPAQDLPSGAEDGNGESSAPDTEYDPSQNPENPGESGGDTATDPGTPSGTETPDSKPEASDVQVPEQPETSGSRPAGETQASQPPAGSAPDAGAETPPAGNGVMTFSAVQESVTPKDAVNLRTAPTTTDENNIVVKIQNGEALSRTGINNDTGWSRIDYNGQTLYAVSQYLTTDLNYKPPVQPSNPNRVNTLDGRVIIFADCDDWISPKEYVNLRTEPSTSEGDGTVSCQLQNGEKAHRTGYSADSGWSRVEYNGQVLYVVTSLVYVVTEE